MPKRFPGRRSAARTARSITCRRGCHNPHSRRRPSIAPDRCSVRRRDRARIRPLRTLFRRRRKRVLGCRHTTDIHRPDMAREGDDDRVDENECEGRQQTKGREKPLSEAATLYALRYRKSQISLGGPFAAQMSAICEALAKQARHSPHTLHGRA
jgi:hypothetical protein